MTEITFQEAKANFEKIFDLAAEGETVVIQRNKEIVTVQCSVSGANEIAPAGYFDCDYSTTEIDELNLLASKAPRSIATGLSRHAAVGHFPLQLSGGTAASSGCAVER